jgi:hypothetical protein
MGKWGFLRAFTVQSAVMCGLFFPLLRAAPVASAAQEQTPSAISPPNSAPTTHKGKVWTNEDLIATRTPADIYIFQREEQAAAEQDAAFSSIASCFAFGQAEGNAEETQKEIDATLQSISDSEDAVAQSRKALRTSPDNLRLRNQMELAQHTAELNHARERLWKLQEHLQEIENRPAPNNTPSQ